MPTSLPLTRLDGDTGSSWGDFGTGLLMVWAVSMLLFAAIATFGKNETYYDAFYLMPTF